MRGIKLAYESMASCVMIGKRLMKMEGSNAYMQ